MKKEIIKEEQLFLDNVLHNIDLKIEEVKNDKENFRKEIEDIGVPDLEDRGLLRKYKEAYYKTNGKIYKLKEDKKNTHFGRLDLKIKEEDKRESIIMYIGEKSITDSNHRIIVYDWRSPVANLYYMANQTDFKYNDTYYDLLLKRQIEIENSKLIDCYDIYKKGESVNVTDTFLLKILEQKKNRNEFSDIIRTIQSNQNLIIRNDVIRNMVVQGVAGSGKTVVLLHRISYLLYKYSNIEKEKIIFITPSKIFASKLININRSLSLNNITMITMEEYYFNKIKKYLPGIKIKIINKDYNVDEDLLSLVYSKDFYFKMDEYIKEYLKNLSLELEKLNIKIDYLNIYKSLNNIDNQIKKLIDNDSWNTLEERDILNRLSSQVKSYLKRDNIKKITDIIYSDLKDNFKIKKQHWINSNTINKYMAHILLSIYLKYGYVINNDYKYMFIDEMQDYSYFEFKNVIRLENNPVINLYGDIHQNLNSYIQDKTIKDLVDMLKEELKTDNVVYFELNENYRNSKQITEYCNTFIKQKMNSMGISSKDVFIKNIKLNEIVLEIKNNYDEKFVILTNNQKILDQLEPYERYSIKMAKGLEFSKVIVIDDGLNPVERYVGFTRTLDELYIYNII